MASARRQEFTRTQKRMLYKEVARAVGERWPELKDPAHFICEGCGYVSADRKDFEVDHVFATARGGHNDRHPVDVTAQLKTKTPNVFLLATVGFQAQVLCKGCNRSKSDDDFRRRGTGYALTRKDADQNPEHRYHGAPVMER